MAARLEPSEVVCSLWHETEDRMMAVPGLVSAAGFYVDRRDGANLAACCEILNLSARTIEMHVALALERLAKHI